MTDPKTNRIDIESSNLSNGYIILKFRATFCDRRTDGQKFIFRMVDEGYGKPFINI
jgi:hypothetical protein